MLSNICDIRSTYFIGILGAFLNKYLNYSFIHKHFSFTVSYRDREWEHGTMATTVLSFTGRYATLYTKLYFSAVLEIGNSTLYFELQRSRMTENLILLPLYSKTSTTGSCLTVKKVHGIKFDHGFVISNLK